VTRVRRAAAVRIVLAATPALMLSVGVPFVNRIEPRIFGLPFIMAWIIVWTLLTPVCLSAIDRLQRRS